MGGAAPTQMPNPIDYSSALTTMSNNNQQVMMAQIGSQMIGMQLNSADRSMQIAANLTEGLERLDTKLQIAKLNFLQGIQAEENRHVESMATIDTNHEAMQTDLARMGYSEQEINAFLQNPNSRQASGTTRA